jgi:hypothetical protein
VLRSLDAPSQAEPYCRTSGRPSTTAFSSAMT